MGIDTIFLVHLLLIALCAAGVLLSYTHKDGDKNGAGFKFSAGAVVIVYMVIFGLIVPALWEEQPFWAALISCVIMGGYVARHIFTWISERRNDHQH